MNDVRWDEDLDELDFELESDDGTVCLQSSMADEVYSGVGESMPPPSVPPMQAIMAADEETLQAVIESSREISTEMRGQQRELFTAAENRLAELRVQRLRQQVAERARMRGPRPHLRRGLVGRAPRRSAARRRVRALARSPDPPGPEPAPRVANDASAWRSP